MGCGAGKTRTTPVTENDIVDTVSAESDKPAVKRASTIERNEKKLLDYYVVGEMLGQGAFGVVYDCKLRGGGGESMAVKMVDKAETQMEKIEQEAALLRKMNHPHVIKCHDVFNEKCFVCIVMDRIHGGDLISAMQRHWKSDGRIPFQASAIIVGQMSLSLEYLHENHMVHRDVKGDNYLCSVGDVRDPDIRIVITDFGTVKEIDPPDKRLSEKCGTKLYWSPEFYKQDYSYKVDIWAMGVVFYGLLNGRFPFRNETEVNNKQVKLGKEIPEELRQADFSCLQKAEGQRCSASDLVQNPAFKSVTMDLARASKLEPDDAQVVNLEGDELFRDLGANEGIRERRLELVDRLVDAHENAGMELCQSLRRTDSTTVKGKAGSQDDLSRPHYCKDVFNIHDKRAGNSVFRYEWWPVAKVDAECSLPDAKPSGVIRGSALVLPSKAADSPESQKQAGIEVVSRMLREHGIDTSGFGKGNAKTVEELCMEIQHGSAVLMLDAQECKKLVRVVDVVCLRVVAPGKNVKFLVESGEVFPDGRRRTTNRLPGTKKEPWESTRQTAERIMKELVHMGEVSVAFNYDQRELFEEEEMSPSYPGVFTVYRKEIVEGVFVSQDSKDKKVMHRMKSSAEWSAEDRKHNTKFFRWLTEEECNKQGVVYRAPNILGEVSSLVQAPIGIAEEELENYLKQNGVDTAKFGKDNAKSLEDLSVELIRGDCTLVPDAADGSMLRVVEDVLIKLVNESTGKALVQTQQIHPDGTKVSATRLPGMKRRPDENQFTTARRILKRSLKIRDNDVTTSADKVNVVEEAMDSVEYPGFKTIYRKRIITAVLEF